MENKRKYVIPGDVVTSGPFRPEQNVILDGNKIISTTIGISEIYDDSVRVIPLTGKYIPKINDLVIGKVISHTSLSWELDINSCYVGFLPAQDVFGRDFSAHADELTSKLKTGDLVAARIANFDRTRDPLVTISDRDLGKIDSGELGKNFSKQSSTSNWKKRYNDSDHRDGNKCCNYYWTEWLGSCLLRVSRGIIKGQKSNSNGR